MGTKKVAEYSLKINTLIDDAQKDLDSFKNSLHSLWQIGQPPKSYLKKYEDLKLRLASLREIADKGVVDSSDLKQASNDYKEFQKVVRNLGIEFKSFTEEQKRSLISSEEQASFKSRTQAVDNYTKIIKKNNEVLKEREKVKNQLDEEELTLKLGKLAKEGTQERIDKLKKSGSFLFPEEAKKFQENQKKALEITKEIEQIQKNIKAEEAKGAKDTGKNKLSRAKALLEEKQQQLNAIDLITGKEAFLAHEEVLRKAEQELKYFSDEVEETEQKVSKLKDRLDSFETIDNNAEFKKLKNTLKELGVEGIEDAKSIEQIKKVLSDLENASYQKVVDYLQEIQDHVEEMSGEGEKIKKEIDKGTEAVEKQNKAIAEQDAIKQRIKQFLGMAGAIQVLRSSFRDAFSTITELDATMTEMAVVTDLTVGDYWEQLPEYSQRARELGVSINSAYKAATLYYQQGLKTNEVNEISVETLKMAKIANMDAAEATNKMTAALRGFNMELNETSAKRVSDVYSELAAITAADTNEIANAMTKTASIAYSAGMEFETTAAFLSQIIETTRESAETAGTAMKTVVARFQELKKDPSEIGEVDGEIVDANAIETALRSVGVSLRDARGQFRELDDVFLELSSKWNTLDKNTQRYIATIAAGSRQQSRFIAMMQDYERTQDLVTAANNSAGASQKQFEKTTESLQAKIENLKSAWHEFTMSIMNSELVKFGVDLLTSLLEIINKSTKAFGGLGGSLMKIVGIMAIFKTGMKIFNKFETPILNLFKRVTQLASVEGFNAGAEWTKAAKKGAQAELQGTDQTPIEEKGKDTTEKSVFDKAFGIDKFKQYKNQSQIEADKAKLGELQTKLKQGKADLADNNSKLKAKQEELNRAKKLGWKKDDTESGRNGAVKAREKATKLEAEIVDLKKENTKKTQDLIKTEKELGKVTDNISKNSKEGWKLIGEGLTQIGQTAVAAGVGLSLFGGILSSLGFEEAGEAIGVFGNAITLLGAGATILIPLMTKLVGVLVAGGISTGMAWGWVTIILAGITALIVSVISAANKIKEASPEKQLERASEAADKAAESADNLRQKYEDLKSSIEKIKGTEDSLKGLIKGTDEYNSLMDQLNTQVLDFINTYPTMAKFIKNTDGFLTLDTKDPEFDKALKKAEANAKSAQLSAQNAKLTVIERSSEVNYKNLTDDAKIDYTDPETARDLAYNGALLTGMAAGAGSGAIIGTGAGPIGTAVGAIVGALGGYFASQTGAEEVGQYAYEKAQKSNQEGEIKTRQLAEALASGAIYEENGTYKRNEDVDFSKFYKLNENDFQELYDEVGESTEALKAFGQELITQRESLNAQYDVIGTNIYNLLDRSTWGDEENSFALNVLDSGMLGAMRDQIRNDLDEELDEANLLGNVDDSSDAPSQELINRRDAAIKAQYGENAFLEETDEGYVIKNTAGEQLENDVNEEYIKNLISSYELEGKAKTAVQDIPQILDKMKSDLGNGEEGLQEAIGTVFGKEGVKKLNKAQVEMLQNTFGDERDLREYYKNNEELQTLFGSEKNFIEKFMVALKGAENALLEVPDELKNSIDAEHWSGIKSNLQEYADKIGTKSAEDLQEMINSLMEEIASEFPNVDLNAISELITSTDLTSWSGLNSLVNTLSNTYGIAVDDLLVNTDNFEGGFVSSIANITNASETLAEKLNRLGVEMTFTEKSLNRLNHLQEAFEFLLDLALDQGKYSSIQTATQSAIESISNSWAQSHDLNELSNKIGQYTTLISKFATENDLDPKEFTISSGSGGMIVDWSKIDGLYSSNDLTSQAISGENLESGKTSLKDIAELEENLWETAEQLKQDIQTIKEYEQQGLEAYEELRSMAEETIVGTLQEQIDLQSEAIDATKEANSRLLSKLQEQIDADRQREQKEESENNISDLLNKQTYLAMDTSGANALEQKDIDEQIQKAEKEYQNLLIDQAIQNLQDANAKAEEQRERQISIAQAQLDAYTQSSQFQERIEMELDTLLSSAENWDSSALGVKLIDWYGKNMNKSQFDTWFSSMSGKVALANNWTETDWANIKNNLTSSWSELVKALTGSEGGASEFSLAAGQIVDGVTGANKTTLSNIIGAIQGKVSQGFEDAKIAQYDKLYGKYFDINSSEEGSKIDEYMKLDKDATINARSSAIKSKFNSDNYLTREEYYKEYEDDIKKGTHTETYSQYLGNKIEEVDKIIQGVQELASHQGAHGLKQKDGYSGLLQDYRELTGKDEEDLLGQLKPFTSGTFYGGYAEIEESEAFDDWDEEAVIHLPDGTEIEDVHMLTLEGAEGHKEDGLDVASEKLSTTITNLSGEPPKQGWLAMYDEVPYVYYESIGRWVKIHSNKDNDSASKYSDVQSAMKKYLNTYKTGGLADFTGPAWLDGTPSKPEYVLNSAQTERFFSLIDVLEGFDEKNSSEKKTGDNYFDIEINVEKLENDYDVEKVADKIRRMIYEDATYRNVNAINHIR